MSKPTFQPNPRVKQIFEDLEKYLSFCQTYGYKYDEGNLYDMRNYVYRQFQKFITGKPVKDNWEEIVNK
jgi:hypothetical protein